MCPQIFLNSAFPTATGSAASKNAQGQQVLESIVKDPTAVTKANKFGGVDVISSNGKGASFYKDALRGFLEP